MSGRNPRLQIKFMSKHEAQISYKGEVLSWNIFPYFKGNNTLTYDVFEQINAYLVRMPEINQSRIFDAYKRILSLLEMPTTNLDNDLKKLVTELLNNTDLNDVKNWIDLHANVVVPSVLESVYIESDENTGNRNRTYIQEDYKWLIAMSIVLRLMTPVWGEYISRTSKEKGNNFKEYYAADLITDSYLEQSDPMVKLKLFVMENIPKDKPITSAILAAFSVEDFPDLITRLVVVRKLCLEDIRGINNDSHLIKVVFQFIRHRLKTVDGNFYGIIKEKFTVEQSSSSDDNNNLSKIEGYKIRQELPAGDVATLRISLTNPLKVAKRLCPTMDNKFLKESIDSVAPLMLEPISPAQRALLQYIFKPIVPTNGLLLLSKKDLVRNIGVAQAILWKTRWFDMAALLTGIAIPNNEYLNIGFAGVRARITKVQQDRLDYLYPYTRRPQGKQRTIKNQNVAITAIEKLTDVFTSNDWKLNIPQSWIEQENLNIKIARYSAPADIRVKIADFVIAIAEHELPFSTVLQNQPQS